MYTENLPGTLEKFIGSEHPTANQTLADSVRKIGAELLLEVERTIQNILIDKPPHPSDLDRHVLKFHLLESENQSATEEVKVLLNDLVETATEWATAMRNPECSLALTQKTLQYFEQNWTTFVTLCQRTALNSIPAASDLGLSLVEFDTEVSGLPTTGCDLHTHSTPALPSFSVLSDVVSLEETLTIDRTVNKPQSGFAFAESTTDLLSHLSKRQAHLFTAYQGKALVGFYLPIFGPESAQSFLSKQDLAHLKQQGVLSDQDRPGWVEIVGTSSQNRHTLARAGIHLYDIFDAVVMRSAKKEGASILLGLVREGPQANRSIKAHLRKGWEKTGVISTGPDGKTPYHVLSRRIAPASSVVDFEHAEIATASHFELNDCAFAAKNQAVEHTNSITNGDALKRCRDFFSHIYPRPVIVEWQGYHEFSIQVKEGRGTIFHFLRQARPHTDLWKYNSPFGNDHAGSLADVLPTVAADLGYPIHPDYN